jgi:signal transduction histidine kinase
MDQFVDDYLAALYEERQRDNRRRWVQDKLTADFMHQALTTWYTSLGAIVLTFAFLFQYIRRDVLLLWLVFAVIVQLHQRWIFIQFDRTRHVESSRQLLMNNQAFFNRYRFSWALMAVVVAAPMFAYYEQVPSAIELVCLSILIALAVSAAVQLASRPDCLRLFALFLALTVLCAVLWRTLKGGQTLTSASIIVFVALFMLFGILMLRLGKSLYSAQLTTYEANFDNEQLITSLRQQTHAAFEAVQLKNNLLASATHDLAQPLHALSFYADLLRNDPASAKDVLPKILKASDSVNALFFSLFDFARIESGAVQIKQERIELQRLLGEIANQFEPVARTKGLHIRVHLPRVVPVVSSDPVHLRRIISNLVSNAVRYTDKGGVLISARYWRSRQRWLVEVYDTGLGIAAEDLPHVFKEFYRAPGHEGTADSFGLGLAIVQKLCRALNVEIQMKSSKGKGTLCRLILPVSDHAA